MFIFLIISIKILYSNYIYLIYLYYNVIIHITLWNYILKGMQLLFL